MVYFPCSIFQNKRTMFSRSLFKNLSWLLKIYKYFFNFPETYVLYLHHCKDSFYIFSAISFLLFLIPTS